MPDLRAFDHGKTVDDAVAADYVIIFLIMKRPYFLWDYNFSDLEVKKIIKRGDKFTRNFLVSRILESAKFEDVWKYITLENLVIIFPELKLKKEIKQIWKKAFQAWGYNF